MATEPDDGEFRLLWNEFESQWKKPDVAGKALQAWLSPKNVSGSSRRLVFRTNAVREDRVGALCTKLPRDLVEKIPKVTVIDSDYGIYESNRSRWAKGQLDKLKELHRVAGRMGEGVENIETQEYSYHMGYTCNATVGEYEFEVRLLRGEHEISPDIDTDSEAGQGLFNDNEDD